MTWTNLARLSLAFLYLTALPVAMPAQAQQKTVPAAGVSSGGSTVQVFTGDFNPRGAWSANTAYAVKDVVSYQGSAYVVTQAYTSGASFTSPNLALLVAGGQPGPTGRGITGGSFNAAGHLILNMTDGTTSDAGLFPTAPAGSGTSALAASAPSITFGTPTLDANGVTYDVTYTVTASVTGTAPISYQVEYKASTASAFVLVGTSGSALSGTIIGLAPSVAFTGQVVASNVLGPVSSAAKTFSTPALPAVAPGAPVIAFGSPTLDANGTTYDETYTITPSLVGTAPVSYQAEYQLAGASSYTLFGTAGSALTGTITGLPPSSSFNGRPLASNAATPSGSPVVGSSTVFSTPALPAAAAAYVAYVAPVPNVIYQIDASEPASLAGPAAGQPGLQIDASGNLLGGNEAISQTAFSHGYGEVSLVTTGGPNGKPYLHGTSTSFNKSYDGIVLPAGDAAQFFGQAGQSFHATFLIRQTGANSTALLQAYNSGNNQQFVINWGSDGSIRGGQNTGGGSLTEPSSALTTFGQWEILDIYGNGQNGTTSIYRNCALTYTSADSNPLGGLSGTTAFEIMNNGQADLALATLGNGLPSQAQHQASCNALASKYAIPGAIGTVAAGPTSAIAPLVPDLTQNFLTAISMPSTAAPPTEATPSLHDGLTLASGSVSLANYTFGPGGTVPNRAALDADFFYTPINGNLTNPSPKSGDPQAGNTTSYTRVARFAAGSPYDLHTLDASGLSLNAVCSQNNTAAGCTNGNLLGGMIRSPVAIVPGDTISVSYTGASSQLSWTPIWLYNGLEISPGPGGNPYFSGSLQLTACYHELDMNDFYKRPGDGVGAGFVLDSDIVPQYEYATNANGLCFHKAPKRVYEANGPAFIYHPNGGPPYSQTASSLDQSVGKHTLVLNWRGDGSNLVDYILDGKLYNTEYWEYGHETYVDANGVTQPIPMHLIIGNTAIPTFLPAANQQNIVPQDGGSIAKGPWSIVVSEIKIIKGNVSNTAAATTDTNSTNLPGYGLSDYVVPTAAVAAASPAGTLGGVSFYPVNDVNATVTGGGANPLVLTAPTASTNSVKQGLVLPFDPTKAGTRVFRFAYPTPGTNFVNAGMMVVGANGYTGIASFFSPQKLEGDLWSDPAGDNQNQFFPSTVESLASNSADYCEELVSDGNTLSFFGAPADPATNTCHVWTPLGSQPAAAIGSGAYAGLYVDNLVANPPASGQPASAALPLTIKATGATTASSVQNF